MLRGERPKWKSLDSRSRASKYCAEPRRRHVSSGAAGIQSLWPRRVDVLQGQLSQGKE